MTWLLVAVGAAVGAPLRYLVDRALRRGRLVDVPLGTFTVNIAGSLVLGALLGLGDASVQALALVGTGFCGALTTYSTFAWETLELAQVRARIGALAYLVASVAGGVGAAFLGFAITGSG
ncbi:fluoride efflux transporter CrcB [Nocardioides sp. AE5]|uniref:fluoride efflux transporter CrcB n=1 Tax=Nocardioides sp. AE5 TaxID=2962573 RepID=UPI0028817721|nr:fluoride efflux transporter CrcB [Nocardioides sp. AE5]MDT0200314.1 fluoride efflux transporter CrcB [Nocardioides sp. AE5]